MRSVAIRRTIRKVMDWVKLLLVLATCVYLANCLKQCGQSSPEQPTERTVTFYDTIPYYYPVARDSVVVRYETHRLPIDTTAHFGREDNFITKNDSADVVIPISQKEYQDSTYHVWINVGIWVLQPVSPLPLKECSHTSAAALHILSNPFNHQLWLQLH